MRIFLKLLSAFAVVIGSFYGTLYLLDRYDLLSPDPVASEARALKEALQKYRLADLPYPKLQNAPLSDLKKQLVTSGFASNIPEADKDARYVSVDGKSYGLLFHINRTPANPAGTPCIIEVDSKGNNWWSMPPACLF